MLRSLGPNIVTGIGNTLSYSLRIFPSKFGGNCFDISNIWLFCRSLGPGSNVDLNRMAAGGRILWGAAFSLAILKTIKVSFVMSEVVERSGARLKKDL